MDVITNRELLRLYYDFYTKYSIRNITFFSELEARNLSVKMLEDYAEYYVNNFGTEEEKEKFLLVKDFATYRYKKYSPEKIAESKPYFKLFIECNGDVAKIIEKFSYKVTFATVFGYSNVYYRVSASKEEREAYCRIMSTFPKDYFKNIIPVYLIFVNKLLSFESPVEAVEYLTENNISRNYYDSSVLYYRSRNHEQIPNSQMKLNIKRLQKIREEYIKSLKNGEEVEINEMPEKMGIYISTIKEYLSGTKTISELLQEKNIEYNNFRVSFNSMPDEYHDLIEKYKERINKEKQDNHERAVAIAKQIVEMLKHGVLINGQRDEFTMLDYYFLTGDLNEIEYTSVTSDDIGYENNMLFKRFLKNNSRAYNHGKSSYQSASLKPIMNIEFALQSQYTFLLNGVPVTPDIEERREIVNYLQEKNVLITEKVLKTAIKRYAYGILTDDIEVYSEEKAAKYELKNTTNE